MKNILITGSNGFVGNHLIKELLAHKYSVIGVGRGKNQSLGLTKYYDIDLTNLVAVRKIDFSNIDAVVNLAGLATVGESFNYPARYIDTNLNIEINLYESTLEQKVHPKFLIISTGGLYDPLSKLPLTENSKVFPSSPYSVSKVAQEELAKYYSLRGFDFVIARPFNHIGPGQRNGFLIPDIAQQIANFKKDTKEMVRVGNINTKRDYTDVRDIARAYRLLLEKGSSGETYNICSSRAVSVEEILTIFKELSKIDFKISILKSKLRETDTSVIYGSNFKLQNATNWQPTYKLEETLTDVLNYWKDIT